MDDPLTFDYMKKAVHQEIIPTLTLPKEELEAFLEAVRQSEVGYFIRQEHASWSEAKNEFRGFEITH